MLRVSISLNEILANKAGTVQHEELERRAVDCLAYIYCSVPVLFVVGC